MKKLAELFNLSGRVAVVTGATGLLGKFHSEALAEAGADVILTDLDERSCDELARNISLSFGIKCSGKKCDVTKTESILELRDFIKRNYGKLDILVNNAAINDSFENHSIHSEVIKFENFPLELWNHSINVNLTGVFLCSQILGSMMTEQRSGNIINIASTYGIVAPYQDLYLKPDGSRDFFKSAVYPVTKSAVIMFTKYLASYWGKYGIRVNSLSPGGVENNQEEYFIKNYSLRTPLGRMSRTDEYKAAIVFLSSDASSYMTGSNLVIDGGWTCW